MKRLLLLILTILLTACSGYSYVEINGERITVEIAQTPEEKQEGLMFRESLCMDCGMLFVFENEDFHSFWMKNTPLALDMIFIDSNLSVVDMLHAVPCFEDPCKRYIPGSKAQYILETNAGRFDEEIIGEKIEIN